MNKSPIIFRYFNQQLSTSSEQLSTIYHQLHVCATHYT